ncbi:MAG: GNAT family N-acetyltransferase [Bdellovibrionaceae bacterium]|nr:GNAT family N-acetyltransferase [Pseudobdellovibrionaceae bacterium]
MNIRIEQLTEQNFKDYETLTSCESGGGCYCSFWHQKISSMQEWETRRKENPMLNRQVVLDKVQTGFHVGVLVYSDADLLAWISVGPLIDYYWTWKRTIQFGEESKNIAGITCFTVAPKFRGQGLQSKILEKLKEYGKEKGWSAIEGYPFDASAIEKHKEHVLWPGLTKGFEEARFLKIGPHWLNNPEAERSIYKVEL